MHMLRVMVETKVPRMAYVEMLPMLRMKLRFLSVKPALKITGGNRIS